MTNAINADCIDFMRELPDNAFDLAVVDPPYGATCSLGGGCPFTQQYKNGPQWNIAPDQAYFTELFRVSKNQIIFGGNYFDLPPCRCFIVWDKKLNENFSFSMAELAWTSFDCGAKIFYGVSADPSRIHATQKPVALYRWVYSKFSQPGMTILDTHLGSGSSRIAAEMAGLDFTGIETDTEMFKLQNKRFKTYQYQQGVAF